MLITEEKRDFVVGSLNWPELFPSKPSVCVSAWHSGAQLTLEFSCDEGPDGLKAEYTSDKDPVWEDSCVEFFFAPFPGEGYYNIECNPRGCIYMCYGKDRAQRTFLPESSYKAIVRTVKMQGAGQWGVRLEIPSSVFCLGSSFSEYSELTQARGNLYKCGGVQRHYLSFFPILTPRPDFHRPEYFGKIEFGV